jgi:hypothetical protein
VCLCPAFLLYLFIYLFVCTLMIVCLSVRFFHARLTPPLTPTHPSTHTQTHHIHSLAHTNTYTLLHTHTLSLSLSLFLSHTHTHTHTHTHSHSLVVSLTHSLLEEQYSLSSHLRSLRRFFLLEHGDFFIQVLHAALCILYCTVHVMYCVNIVYIVLVAVFFTLYLLRHDHSHHLFCLLFYVQLFYATLYFILHF